MNKPPFHLLALAATLSGSVALAQGFADPTRPPAAIEQPAGAEGAAAGQTGTGLQTILMRQGGKPAAIINGEFVVLGGRVGEARLVRVSEGSVTLRGPAGKDVLYLTPGIEKKPAEADEKKPMTRKRQHAQGAPREGEKQ